ncbi:MAG: Rne/Rng family ribonuclease [Hyphomicrobium sp.]
MSNNKMLIDATHPEETRVVVLRNGRVEEFDYESAARKLLRGNVYLAKVTRVEPSLQAAFVEYGGNRHGFLAFSEIHPDYYQIPMADRQALLDEEAAEEAREEAEADARAERLARRRGHQGGQSGRDADRSDEDGNEGSGPQFVDEDGSGDGEPTEAMPLEAGSSDDVLTDRDEMRGGSRDGEPDQNDDGSRDEHSAQRDEDRRDEPRDDGHTPDSGDTDRDDDRASTDQDSDGDVSAGAGSGSGPGDGGVEVVAGAPQPTSAGSEAEAVEQTGSEDALEELPSRPRRHRRSYKIQEVIKRRQVILVQVVKEERGNKGAALTTYLSLAGRYTVLMPNTARGGGISRKITNPQDRKRLKAIATELEVPEGMGLIIRTAGAARTKQEIKRDFEYLLRLWESVRDLTLASSAPSLVYEEGNLIKRSIRDLYNKDVEEIVVAGEQAHSEAKDFMRMLMPSHTKHVVAHEDREPLFTRYGIERQLNAMFSPYVTLKSGGYLVINQTEALVAIDVNSGKATREFSIEETALNTNLEASDEIARQLKLRDLAGLIVIDFIDMEEKRNNRSVERRLKDALRFDRARIQLGHISHFGLMEMSRQRMRTGVLEGSTSQCPHCQGTGIIRSTESVALAVLRGLEDALMAGARSSLIATTTAQVALYILNNKRQFINDMEARHTISVTVQSSDKLQGANFTIEKGAAPLQPVRRPDRAAVNMEWGFEGEAEAEPEVVDAAEERVEPRAADGNARDGQDRESDGEGEGEDGRGRGRRRRRGRRGNRDRQDQRPDQRADQRADQRPEQRSEARGEHRGPHRRDRGEGGEFGRRPFGEGPRDGDRGFDRNASRSQPRDGERTNGHQQNGDAPSSGEFATQPEYSDQPVIDFAGDAGAEGEPRTEAGRGPAEGAEARDRDGNGGRRRRRGRRGGRRGRDRGNGGPEFAGTSEDGNGAEFEAVGDGEAPFAEEGASPSPAVEAAEESPSLATEPVAARAPREPREPRQPSRHASSQVSGASKGPTSSEAERSVEPQPASAPVLSRAARNALTSEPKIERVVVRPDPEAGASTEAETAEPASGAPSRKGWWQRTLGGG